MSATNNAYRKAARQLAQKSARTSPSNTGDSMGRTYVGSFMLPGTMVAPPFIQTIRQSPTMAVKLQMERVKVKFMDALRMVGTCMATKPSLLASSRIRINRASIVSTAKELHRSLSEAFAAGDLDTLRRVCFPALYQTLSYQVSQRPAGIRKHWELVNYTSTWRHPRIVDHKIMQIPRNDGTKVVAHQAVVTISSRQRLTQFNDYKDGVSTGPPKELDVKEHLILMREIDENSFTTTDWRAFGYADETTYQDWQKEKRGLELLGKQGSA